MDSFCPPPFAGFYDQCLGCQAFSRSLDFGKHNGRHIDQVDNGYLHWIVKKFPDSGSWWKTAASALTNRQQSAKANVLSDLKSCIKERDLQKGRKVHKNAVQAGIDSDIYVAAALIKLYAKCGSMQDARTVFDSIKEHNAFSWTAMVQGYVDNGNGLLALEVFSKMKDEGRCAPDSFTYVAALKACTLLVADEGEAGKTRYLERARQIHSEIGHHMDYFVQNTLINLYAKCGSLDDARTVLDSYQGPDVVSWNALILAYADSGQGLIGLHLFSIMKEKCTSAPDSFTYVAALKACTSLAADGGEAGKQKCLERGRQIHSNIGLYMNLFVQNTLINLYARCGDMDDAKRVFDSIQDPDVVSWNALILGYADNGHGLVGLDLFSKMKDDGRCQPDPLTYVAALKACTLLAADGGEAAKQGCLERGRQIHLEIGCHMDHFVQSTLINLYAKCGSMVDAMIVFKRIRKQNLVCWNALILGYADNGLGQIALDLFSTMKDEGRCAPNSLTYVAALKACISLAADGGEAGRRECLQKGRQIHSHVGCNMHHFVQNTLVNLYAKSGSMEEARTVFDSIEEPDVVSWNALILGYADNGQGLVALDLFSRMKGEGICAPNSITYVAALKACTLLAANGSEAGKGEFLERAKQIHLDIGYNMDHFVQSMLIKLYGKCGAMEDARRVFDSIQEPEVMTWTALILAYVDNGEGLVALDLFSRIKDDGRYALDSFTYVAALMACCSTGALASGRRIHSVIREFDSHVVTCLVDFYAKCGSMEEAREVFDLYPRVRDVSTWNALLAGYARFGDIGTVFDLFEAMQDQGFHPDAVTFVSVLSCCGHAGLLHKASEYLEVMPTRHRVTPDLVHYNCMIDLLGRGNRLDEAVVLLKKMPCDPNVVTWTTLLGACRKWRNVEIGRWAFESLMDLDQKNSPAYVLMAEIYGSRGMWEEQERVLHNVFSMNFV